MSTNGQHLRSVEKAQGDFQGWEHTVTAVFAAHKDTPFLAVAFGFTTPQGGTFGHPESFVLATRAIVA